MELLGLAAKNTLDLHAISADFIILFAWPRVFGFHLDIVPVVGLHPQLAFVQRSAKVVGLGSALGL